MTERYIIDDAGTLIDIETRNTYDYVNEVCELLNGYDKVNENLSKVLVHETEMHRKWKNECANEIQENNRIKNTIREMYENERTELGKSVLKQLMEAIQ